MELILCLTYYVGRNLAAGGRNEIERTGTVQHTTQASDWIWIITGNKMSIYNDVLDCLSYMLLINICDGNWPFTQKLRPRPLRLCIMFCILQLQTIFFVNFSLLLRTVRKVCFVLSIPHMLYPLLLLSFIGNHSSPDISFNLNSRFLQLKWHFNCLSGDASLLKEQR